MPTTYEHHDRFIAKRISAVDSPWTCLYLIKSSGISEYLILVEFPTIFDGQVDVLGLPRGLARFLETRGEEDGGFGCVK